MRFWRTGPPENFHVKSSHRGQVTVWVAKLSHSLLGPIFLNETVNCEWYLHMLQNDLPPFMANGLPLHTEWYMQEGVTPLIAKTVLHLNTVFGPHIMSNCYPDRHNCGNFWPRVSLDLNPCNFFFVGILEGGVPMETIQWILDNRNACWVVQRGWGRLVSP